MRFLYRLTDGVLAPVGVAKFSVSTGVIDVSDHARVDMVRDRVDLATKQIRPATAQELAARDAELRDEQALSETRRADILATIAWMVRRDMGPAVFDALGPAQKKAAVLNQVEVWRTIRASVERMVS